VHTARGPRQSSPLWPVGRTIRPASSSNVQRARPLGGAEQATAPEALPPFDVSFLSPPGRGSSDSAASKALLDESPLGPECRRSSDRYTGRDLLVGHPGVRSEQHLGSLDPTDLLAARSRTRAGPTVPSTTASLRSVHSSVLASSPLASRPIHRRFVDPPHAEIHRPARSIPRLHPHLLPAARPSPAEADMQRYFRVTPPPSIAGSSSWRAKAHSTSTRRRSQHRGAA